jgi:putative serine protease PepD
VDVVQSSLPALTLSLLLVTVLPCTAADPSGGRAACKARSSVAVIYCNGRLSGTATVVADGLAVTCGHVLRGRHSLQARFLDGEEVACEIAGEDEDLDLALLRLPTTGRRVLPLAKAPPEVGEPVWAVGHPEGYLFSVLSGVISADGRQLEMPGGPTLEGVLQTDAPISPGCSGGPLLNASGQVAGLVIAISRDARGVSFAIPSPMLRDFLKKRGTRAAARLPRGAGSGGPAVVPAGSP